MRSLSGMRASIARDKAICPAVLLERCAFMRGEPTTSAAARGLDVGWHGPKYAALKGGRMRKILVTGGNKGIGFAIAKGILSQHDDTRVLLGSRDRERGEAALRALSAERPAFAGRVALLALDVASDASVTAALQS